MTKRDIIKFLERKQLEKTTSVREVYEATRKQLVKDTYSKLELDTLAEKMQPLLEEARTAYGKAGKRSMRTRVASYLTFTIAL